MRTPSRITTMAALVAAAAIAASGAGLGTAAPAREGGDPGTSALSRVGGGEISGLAVSPRSSRIVYASAFFRGVFKSTDGGRTWRRLAAPGKRFWSVAVNPLRPSTVYAGVMGGVSISRDAGASWSKVVRCCGIEVFAFAFDPRDPQVVLAGGDGVSKSVDGGRTWVASGEPIGGSHVNALVIDPRHPSTAYAGVGGGGGSGPGDPLVSGVFKTTDGAESWQRAGLAGRGVGALVVDPSRPWVVYATHGRRVYRSADAGGTWRPSSAGLGGCYPSALALDPAHPRTVYAGGTCGVFRSTDGARSWSAFADGLGDRAVTELAVSPDGRMLYAGTGGGRVAAVSLPLALP